MTRTITAEDIPRLAEASLAALKAHREEIDRLNVFPVPDGDTGTNMVFTMQMVWEEISKCPTKTMEALTHAVTYGSLSGARGNSGVILSQIFRGFCEVIESSSELSSSLIVEALQNSAKVAYRAISKPVEGTMLTVIKDAAAAAGNLKERNAEIDVLLELVLQEARRSLARTPDLLPVLKEAGVVDAGGYGLVVLGEGVLAALRGERVAEVEVSPYLQPLSVEEEVSLEYTYCTEFLLTSEGIDLKKMEKKLDPLGDSIMVVGTPELTRIHIHTNHPGRVLERATKLGSVSQIQINNMVEQAEERARTLARPKLKEEEIGLVAVASGGGIKQILSSLGAHKIVDGGQSMNPSAAELTKAIEELPCSRVMVLPNNKNVILTAHQAGRLTNKKLVVVPTRSIPEAFAALLAFDPSVSLEENAQLMEKNLSNVKTGEITRAIRDSKSKIGRIKKGNFIGFFDHELKMFGESLLEVTSRLVNVMIEEDDEVITLLVGSDVSKEEADELREIISEAHPDMEIELHGGGQPLYHLIVGVE